MTREDFGGMERNSWRGGRETQVGSVKSRERSWLPREQEHTQTWTHFAVFHSSAVPWFLSPSFPRFPHFADTPAVPTLWKLLPSLKLWNKPFHITTWIPISYPHCTGMHMSAPRHTALPQWHVLVSTVTDLLHTECFLSLCTCHGCSCQRGWWYPARARNDRRNSE